MTSAPAAPLTHPAGTPALMRSRSLTKLEWGLVFIATIPLIALILYVVRYGYTVPWLDEYTRMVPLVLMQRDGTLTFAEFFVQLSDHRHVIPYVISVLLAALNGGDMRWELAFSILIMVISLLLMFDLYRHQTSSRSEALIFLVPAAILLFSFGQRENWIWGHQKVIFLMMLSTYVSAWAIGRFPRSLRAFWICVGCTWLSAWSFLSGNVLWGVIPIALWLNGYRRWTFYLMWLVIAGISTGFYVSGFVPETSDQPSWNNVFDAHDVRYALAYLGNALSGQTLHLLHNFNGSSGWFQPLIPVSMGLLGIGLLGGNLALAIFVRRVSLRDLSPWLLLIGFSLANGLLLTIGRGGELTGALVARYITLVIPFWIAVIALMIPNLRYLLSTRSRLRRWRRPIIGAMALSTIFLVVGYAANTLRAFEMGESHNAVMEQCFLTRLEADPRCQQMHFFYNSWTSQDEVLVMLERLEEERLFLFKDGATTLENP